MVAEVIRDRPTAAATAVGPDDHLDDLFGCMTAPRHTVLPVVDDRRIVGIIGLEALTGHDRER